MTDQIIKAAGALEQVCNSVANTFTTSSVNGAVMTLRVTNLGTTTFLVTVANAGANVLSFSLPGATVQYVAKYRGDTMQSNSTGANCVAVEVGRYS